MLRVLPSFLVLNLKLFELIIHNILRVENKIVKLSLSNVMVLLWLSWSIVLKSSWAFIKGRNQSFIRDLISASPLTRLNWIICKADQVFNGHKIFILSSIKNLLWNLITGNDYNVLYSGLFESLDFCWGLKICTRIFSAH